MFCQKCGTQIPEGTKFCPNCGAEISFGQKFTSAAKNAFNAAENEMSGAINDVRNTVNGTPSEGERLKDDRGLLPYILLSIITCGIYSYYFIYKMAHDVNIACSDDGESTSGLAAFILLSIVTCGIYSWFWYYKLANRLAANAPRYGLTFQENGTTVLLWLIVGSLLCGIGAYVAMNILITNTNKICNAYNRANNL